MANVKRIYTTDSLFPKPEKIHRLIADLKDFEQKFEFVPTMYYCFHSGFDRDRGGFEERKFVEYLSRNWRNGEIIKETKEKIILI